MCLTLTTYMYSILGLRRTLLTYSNEFQWESPWVKSQHRNYTHSSTSIGCITTAEYGHGADSTFPMRSVLSLLQFRSCCSIRIHAIESPKYLRSLACVHALRIYSRLLTTTATLAFDLANHRRNY